MGHELMFSIDEAVIVSCAAAPEITETHVSYINYSLPAGRTTRKVQVWLGSEGIKSFFYQFTNFNWVYLNNAESQKTSSQDILQCLYGFIENNYI